MLSLHRILVYFLAVPCIFLCMSCHTHTQLYFLCNSHTEKAVHQSGYLMDKAQKIKMANDNLTEARKKYGDRHQAVANCLDALANIYCDYNNWRLAEPLFREALDIRREVLGKENPETLKSLFFLADKYRLFKTYGAAINLCREALAVQEAKFGKDSLEASEPLLVLAKTYAANARYISAMDAFVRVIQIREKHLGNDHPLVADALIPLADMISPAFMERAEKLYKRALSIREKSFGNDGLPLIEILYKLEKLGKAMRNYEEGGKYIARMQDIYGKKYHDFGQIDLSNEEFVAFAYSRTCISSDEKMFNGDRRNKTFMLWFSKLGETYGACGDKFISEVESIFGKDSPIITDALVFNACEFYLYSTLVGGDDERDVALAYLNRAIRINEKEFGENSVEVKKCILRLIEEMKVKYYYQDNMDFTVLEALYMKLIKIDKDLYGETPELANDMINLADIYVRFNKKQQDAEKLYTQALIIQEQYSCGYLCDAFTDSALCALVAMNNNNHKYGVSTFLITHTIRMAANSCDEIIFGGREYYGNYLHSDSYDISKIEDCVVEICRKTNRVHLAEEISSDNGDGGAFWGFAKTDYLENPRTDLDTKACDMSYWDKLIRYQ